MKYDIYFHDDFDGRASAAVMLAFLRSRGDDIAHYVPVDFYLLPQWLDEHFFEKHKLFKGKRYPAIVVDFPYHPKAAVWFDHHETPFRKPGWEKRFTPGKYCAFLPAYPSCCHVVYALLKKNFGWRPPQRFKELVKWLDVIDGANYASARQTIMIKEPALRVDAFIDATVRHPARAAWMVKLLAERPLAQIAHIPAIKKGADAQRAKNLKTLPFYKKNLKRIGNTAFIDLTAAKGVLVRQAAYYLFPDIDYVVRLTMKKNLCHMSVGRNPYRRGKTSLHLGRLLKRYGGGGHKGVGAVDFRAREKALRAIDEIVDILNRKK